MPRDKNIFTLNPTNLDMKRSVFKRVSQHKTSFNLGQLIPIYWDEILPGDTVKMDFADVVRMMTPMAPIMDNIFLDVYAFFIPNRLIWTNWQAFCGENPNGPWANTNIYSIPTTDIGTAGAPVGRCSIGDYLGLPVTKSSDVNSDMGVLPKMLNVSELPLRAYFRVANEWFLNENVQSPYPVTFGDSSNSDPYVKYSRSPLNVNRFHDYFSSCLPAPQKGASVTLPLGDTAPLVEGSLYTIQDSDREGSAQGLLLGSDGASYTNEDPFYVYGQGLSATAKPGFILGVGDAASGGSDAEAVNQINLYADLSAATASTVNALRLAFQLQKLLEKDARGGTRYIELLKAHFGVTSPDARLQRTEYLAGERFRINVDQVVSSATTGSSQGEVLGNTGAVSKTAGRASLFSKSFVEHGLIMIMVCARQDHTYSSMLEKYWLKSKRFDFYYPVLANIGEQPVYKYELDIGSSCVEEADSSISFDPTKVFGYQEAWAEYRYKPSRVSGYLNPRTKNSLNYWTLADTFDGAADDESVNVGLNVDFLLENPVFLDRALTVGSVVTNNFIADFYFDATFSRVMPLYSIPGLIDHH